MSNATPPNSASIVVPRIKADGVLMELDLHGIAASSGSACNLATGEPSHVLRAIGCSRDEYEGSLCFTLGRWTTAAEVETVLATLPPVVERLRRKSIVATTTPYAPSYARLTPSIRNSVAEVEAALREIRALG